MELRKALAIAEELKALLKKGLDGQHDKSMLRPSEAAEFLGVHINTVRRWGDRGLLRSYRLGAGRHRRFAMRDLKRFLRSMCSGPSALP